MQRVLAPGLVLPLPRVLPGLPGGLLAAAGGAGLVVLTGTVRWFIGQYVRSARPHALGGAEPDARWVERTSRRIVLLALSGLAIGVPAGVAGGVYQIVPPYAPGWPEAYGRSLAGLVSLAGLLLLLLSPVLGLAWTVIRDHGAAGQPPRGAP
jgi:hypothetical protein